MLRRVYILNDLDDRFQSILLKLITAANTCSWTSAVSLLGQCGDAGPTLSQHWASVQLAAYLVVQYCSVETNFADNLCEIETSILLTMKLTLSLRASV